MADMNLVADFIVGQDKLTPAFEKIERYASRLGRIAGKDFLPVGDALNNLEGLKQEFPELANVIENTFNQAYDSVRPKTAAFGDQLSELMSESKNAGAVLSNLGELGRLNALGTNVDSTKNSVMQLGAQAGLTEQQMTQMFDRGAAAAGHFDMRMLSVMFSGMALQRVFGGMLRGIKDTFMAAEGDTSALTESTTRLSAAWEFFKFSLFDALNTPFFVNIIDGVTEVIDWFGQLKDDAKISILAIVGGLAFIGSGLFILGQVKLGWDAMLGVGGFFSGIGKITGIAGFGALATGLAAIGLLILAATNDTEDFNQVIADLSAGFDDTFDSLSSLGGPFEKLFGPGGLAEMGTLGMKVLSTIFYTITTPVRLLATGLENLVIAFRELTGEGGFSGAVSAIGSNIGDFFSTTGDTYANIWSNTKTAVEQGTADVNEGLQESTDSAKESLDTISENQGLYNQILEQGITYTESQSLQSENLAEKRLAEADATKIATENLKEYILVSAEAESLEDLRISSFSFISRDNSSVNTG